MSASRFQIKADQKVKINLLLQLMKKRTSYKIAVGVVRDP